MSASLEIYLGASGLALTADLFPLGSDTPAVAGIVLTEATNRLGYYTGAITGLTGVHSLKLYAGASFLPAEYWVAAATSGIVIAVGSVVEAVNTNLNAGIAAILSELADDVGEPAQGDAPVAISRMVKLDWLYKFLRNKADQSDSLQRVYADDGVTVDHKRTVATANNVVTVGEVVSGP